MKFSNGMKKLEEIVKALENQEIDIEEAFKKYKEGVLISKELKEKLDAFEAEINIIDAKNNTNQEGES